MEYRRYVGRTDTRFPPASFASMSYCASGIRSSSAYRRDEAIGTRGKLAEYTPGTADCSPRKLAAPATTSMTMEPAVKDWKESVTVRVWFPITGATNCRFETVAFPVRTVSWLAFCSVSVALLTTSVRSTAMPAYRSYVPSALPALSSTSIVNGSTVTVAADG